MPAQAKKAPFPSANGGLDDPAQTEKSDDSGGTLSNDVIPEDEPINVVTKPEQETARKRKFARVMDQLPFRNSGNGGEDSIEHTTSTLSKSPKQKFTFVGQLKATVFNSPINILLLMVPVGIAVHFTNLSPIGVFVINFIAIIPLAAMLSYATEEIALRTGETLGGLLNATFG